MSMFYRLLLITVTVLFLSLPAFSKELPSPVKEVLKKKFANIVFKIDNSFVVNNETYLPLIPQTIKSSKKIEIIYSVPDKTLPKLLWFSNDWVFVKLIKQDNEKQRILSLSEIEKDYRGKFLKTKFPSDLVVPKGLTIEPELASLIGNLGITIASLQLSQIDIDGSLYLTSPDSGKILHLDLMDPSMIYSIQTMGVPWEITYDKNNKLVLVADLAKGLIYELKIKDKNIFKTIELHQISTSRDIELSEDSSLIYSLGNNNFSLYTRGDFKLVLQTKLPPNPSNFSFLKSVNLLGITCPSTNRLVFLNASDFSEISQIMIDGGPDKIISDPKRNYFYIASRNGNTIFIVDGNTKTTKGSIQVDETPTSLALDSEGRWLYVGNGKANSINIIDLETRELTETISLPLETQFPGDIEITKDGKWLIVTSETTNIISIIDLTLRKVVVKLDVGATTHAAYIVLSNE